MGGADAGGSGDSALAMKKKGARPLYSINKKNVSVEHFKTRFSVYRIREITTFIGDTKKDWIHEAGFGALLSLAEFSIPVKLVRWIMEHVDPLICEFRFENKVIVFTRELVCKILGLENKNLPVKQSGDLEDVKNLREDYKDGARAKIMKCIEVLKASNDRESFIRAFTLLALGTVYCPGIDNYVNLKYLHSLADISQLSSYDWAGHIIECLMDEVKKYQKFTPQQLGSDPQMGSCLIVLAIAYIDFLDLPSDRGTHQINYNLPRICNVTNADFDFVMNVDKRRMQLGQQFGKLTFRDISRTPYGNAPPLEDPIAHDTRPIAPDIPKEAPIVSSLDQWLHQQGSSNHQLQQIPIEYQQVVAQYSNLMEQDVIKLGDSISAAIKHQVMSIWKRRNAEMLATMAELANASRNDDGSAGVSTTSDHAAVPSTSAGDASGDANKGNDKVSDKTSDHISTGYFGDISSFNLFNNGELDDDVAIDNTPPAATNTDTTINKEADVNKPDSNIGVHTQVNKSTDDDADVAIDRPPPALPSRKLM